MKITATLLATRLLTAGFLILVLAIGPRPIRRTARFVDRGPGGPILVIAIPSNPFSNYCAEILRAEGLNAFAVVDIASVSPATLAAHKLAILGEMPLTPAQVTMLSDWVTSGGKLIAMRPDKKLAPLLGLTEAAHTLANAYLLVDTSQPPGAGIVSQTIQFHGSADLYYQADSKRIATLYSEGDNSTGYPAVALRDVGQNHGMAAAFTFDLARSVVRTRQGNPAWSRQRRDGMAWSRSDDLFFGAAPYDLQPDWVDGSKIRIPQADEEQRLLVNLIYTMISEQQPLPRFWYFPNGKKAVIVMTGDDHGNGGTKGRFDHYLAASTPGCSVERWECIRATSYVYVGTPISNSQAAAYDAAGFELALHLRSNSPDRVPTTLDFSFANSRKLGVEYHGCAEWTPAILQFLYSSQLERWERRYKSLSKPATNRTHCVVWSDYSSQPEIELEHGIRLDTNYYYYPGSWVRDRPGLFTGSGIPMRFADENGNTIDVYQAPTQMTDESEQTYPHTVDALLDNAVGPPGFYGAFVVNAHTDSPKSTVSDAVLASALARQVPIVSARQMLEWLDGRNSSSFESLSWDGRILHFSVHVGAGAAGLLEAMVPVNAGSVTLSEVVSEGEAVSYRRELIKGIEYACFIAQPRTYDVLYATSRITIHR